MKNVLRTFSQKFFLLEVYFKNPSYRKEAAIQQYQFLGI